MGSRMVRVDFIPGENEQIETVIKLPEEPRSVIHGIVKDCEGKVIENAVVELFELEDPCSPCSLRPITHTFTDECGEFLFGPLTPYRHYVIKVWVNEVKIRHIVIHPDESNGPYSYDLGDDRDIPAANTDGQGGKRGRGRAKKG